MSLTHYTKIYTNKPLNMKNRTKENVIPSYSTQIVGDCFKADKTSDFVLWINHEKILESWYNGIMRQLVSGKKQAVNVNFQLYISGGYWMYSIQCIRECTHFIANYFFLIYFFMIIEDVWVTKNEFRGVNKIIFGDTQEMD